jgi:hypothetical protein
MFKELHNVKKVAKETHSVNEEKVLEELKEGISLFKDFMKTQDIKTLKKASDKFFSSLSGKRNKAEPFFYISQIFFIFGDKHKAIDYLRAAEEVEPNFKELPRLRQIIFS